MTTWQDLGIETHGKTTGSAKTTCPRCSHTRKKSQYPCLNLDLDRGLFHCWHCDFSGSLQRGEERHIAPPKVYRKPAYRQTPLPARVVEWFATRGIPEATLAKHRISYGPVYMPQFEQELPAIQFPYFRQGEVVNVKYRAREKSFRMSTGSERILYGLDDVDGPAVVIVEGEMDKLSVDVAGYTSCVSVPDGAPAPESKNYEHKFDFLVSAEAIFAACARIILAVDNDAPGQKLAEELARRLGPERCYTVTWSSGCKDANDVLVSYGADTLKECLDAAQPWPVSGIVTIDMLSPAIDYIYHHGMQQGCTTGWWTLDPYYTVRPGEFTILTGIPGHGKSQFVSALAIQLAQRYDWRFTCFSPENYPLERYAAVLMEQYTGIAFDSPEGRMPVTQMEDAKAWLQQHVSFLMPEDDSPTIERLLDLARIQVYREGIKGLILDPWNEIEHSRPPSMTETEYISKTLTQIRRFARLHGVHVWIVAHPTKLHKAMTGPYEGTYPPPTPYDISGSAHWRNKADNCLTVWRDVESPTGEVEVHIQKIRYREIGKPGMVPLRFVPQCGRYTVVEPSRTGKELS